MKTPVQQMKKKFGKLLATVSTNVKKAYDDMVDAVEWNNQEDLVEKSKQNESA